MPFCENCGETIEPGSKFCDNCGVPIDDLSTPQPASLPPPPQAPTFQGSPAPTAPPTSAPIPPIYIAVGIAVVVIIIALVFASGAMSGSSKHVVTPTVTVTAISTPIPKTTVVSGKDPIIGVWRYSSSSGSDDRYRFNADGTWAESYYSSGDTYYHQGTWKAQGGNSYACTGDVDRSIIYVPAKNYIYDTAYSSLILTPYQGDVMTASTSTLTTKTTTLPVNTMAVPGTGSAKDWNDKGSDLLNNKQDYQGALTAYEKAISLDPTNAAYWSNKAAALINLQRYSDGLIAVEKAITLDPTSKYAWTNKGVALELLNRYPEALIAYGVAIDLDPTYQFAINHKNNLESKMNK